MTISDVQKEIAAGKAVRTIVEEAITRAKADPLNAVLTVIEKRALARADEIDKPTAGILRTNDVRALDICKDFLRSFGVFSGGKSQSDVSLQVV